MLLRSVTIKYLLKMTLCSSTDLRLFVLYRHCVLERTCDIVLQRSRKETKAKSQRNVCILGNFRNQNLARETLNMQAVSDSR